MFWGEDVHLYPESRGVTLIFGAWNFPLQLVVIPLVGAIAAGCCAVVKPSEVAHNSALVMAKFFPRYLDQACYRIVEGGVPEAQMLLEQKWDHIFFTGSLEGVGGEGWGMQVVPFCSVHH